MATILDLPSAADLAAAIDAVDKANSTALSALVPAEYSTGRLVIRLIDESPPTAEIPSLEELGRLAGFASGARSRFAETMEHLQELEEHLASLLSLAFEAERDKAND